MIFIYSVIILLIFAFAFFKGKNMLYWSLGSYLISSSVILISLTIYNIIIAVNYSLPAGILEKAGNYLVFRLKLHVSDVVTLYNFGNLLLLSSAVVFLIISDKKITVKRVLLFLPPIAYFIINHPRVKYMIWNHYMITSGKNPFEQIVILNTVILIFYFLLPIVQLVIQYIKTHIFAKKKYALSTLIYILIIEITMALVLNGNSYSNYYPLRYNVDSLPIRSVENASLLQPMLSIQSKYTQLFMSFAVIILLYIFTCCDFSLTFNIKSQRQKKFQRENDEMLKTIFHTYKNAFFAIERFSSILEGSIPKDDKNQKMIDAALDNIKNISHTYYINSKNMINSVVLTYDFNRERVRTNLAEFLKKVILQYDATPNLTVEKHFSEDEIFINANPSELTEAFTNILNNAVEATAENENPIIRIYLFSEGNSAVINFWDNGCGIEKNEIKNIFRPLYSKKDSSSNFGIGLSSALKSISYHSGTIMCKSKLGEYTVFQVVLPKVK